MSMKIVVTGATGYLGSPMVAALLARGDSVTVLSRDGARAQAKLGNVTAVTADLETPGTWGAALAGKDCVIHLAGESVGAKRWDAREKQKIRDSRVEATRMLVEAIGALPESQRPRVLVSASGADYYPPTPNRGDDFDDDEVTEADPPGDTFLARVCRDWEREATNAKKHGLRVVCMRTGVVLGPHGGALDKMVTPFKFLVGGRIGTGRQYLSWIHRDDAVAAFIAAASDDRYLGPVNNVADSTRNAEFSTALGHAIGKPSWLPVPAFAVKLVAGEFADYVLHGRNVVPAKLRALEFTFTKPTLEAALSELSA